MIVVGHDGRAQADDALALGVLIAGATGERLVLVGAYGPEGWIGEEALDARRREILEELQVVADAVPSDVELICRAVPGASPAAALQELAEAEHPRALVVGSCHRSAVGHVLIGGTADPLLQGAPCAVVVAPHGFAEREKGALERLCVGFDGTSESWTALQHAAQLGGAAGAHLRVAMAVPAAIADDRRTAAQIDLDHAVRSVAKRLQAEGLMLEGDAAERLADQSGGADLIVVGSRGYGPVRRVMLGSVSAALMRSARCPVMVVPRSAEFQPTGEGLAAEDEFVGST
jgi:nucleotide-binding universal stress UspA family protein